MPRIQRNLKKIEKKRRLYRETPAKAKTREVIYQIIEEYDKLLLEQSNNPNPEIAKKIEKYQLHLKNKHRLSIYFESYVEAHKIEGTLLSNGKIRELITVELAKKSLIHTEGLIRKPQNISLENTCSTGNIFTILTKQELILDLLQTLSKKLSDKPIKVFSPCNNMIIIIELGDYSPSMNENLELLIQQVLFAFALGNNLRSKKTSDTLKYTLL